MTTFKQLAIDLRVHRASIGRMVKREGITATTQYNPDNRKNEKVVSDQDANFLIEKYAPKEVAS